MDLNKTMLGASSSRPYFTVFYTVEIVYTVETVYIVVMTLRQEKTTC
jgi:hypothetical protein